jgi:transposase
VRRVRSGWRPVGRKGWRRPRERLSDKSFPKVWNRISVENPSAQILSAWIAKEELRTLLSTVRRWGCASGSVATSITNARTEGYNRLLKQIKRVGCGFRNREHFARRKRFHCTRKQRAATQTPP